VRDRPSAGTRIYLEFEYWRVYCPKCQAVKRETLAWLADSGRFTKRFEREIGQQCRDQSIAAVAKTHHLHWEQVRRMEMAYMKDLLAKHPPAKRLRAIGMDEVSIRKGHSYAITVADLDRLRPIWMSESPGRKQEDLDKFFVELGPKRAAGIKLAVMDMWQPFRVSTAKNAPNARVVFDKFHILGHLGDAMDQVRRSEYHRLNGKERKFIKGHRYTLLSNRANLSPDGRRSLKTLLKANRRLHKAYLLKEAFGQLWDYNYSACARTFFENWKAQLKWQRLKPFEEFAGMVDRHWDGIVAYCHPDNKVSLGFMEGLNNKIRTIQRRAFGIKDQNYLKLKVLTSFIKDD
jgi:transposase